MQWFMEDYFKKQENYQKNKVRGTVPGRPNIYDDGLAVLANRIAKELGPDYSWELMGPFGLGANSSLWFTKCGEDMLKHGGYTLDVCPTYDENGTIGFALASGKTDFAGNPTKHFDMPESFEETLCFLTRNEPISPDNIRICYSDVVSILPADPFLLKDMLSLAKNEAIEKYKGTVPELAAALESGRDIVYHFQFEDGKHIDLNIGTDSWPQQPHVFAGLYDADQKLIAGKQIVNPQFAFPGDFNFIVNDTLYSASFGVAIEKDLYPAGLDKISSVEDSLQVMFPEKKLTLDSQILSVSTRAAESRLTSHVKAKEPEPEI